jgi:hypothetical protein
MTLREMGAVFDAEFADVDEAISETVVGGV